MLCIYGNQKLGILPAFSLPPVDTCPGKTALCERVCYGLHGRFQYRNVKEALKRRFDAADNGHFVGGVISEIKQIQREGLFPFAHGKRPFRLHVVGDFYCVDYVEKWKEIIYSCPEVTFYGYTRSWRCPELLEPIEELRQLPNVVLQASTDWSHDDLPPAGWRKACLGGNHSTLCGYDTPQRIHCVECGRCFIHTNSNVRWKLKYSKLVPAYLLASE